MTVHRDIHWIAFEGYRQFAAGEPDAVARAVKQRFLDGPEAAILVFDRSTGQQVDIDLRGSVDDVSHWVARVVHHVPTPLPREPDGDRRGPGRKKLGVVAREVTLLPRHWEWLNRQSGGASAALRKLVDDARVRFADRDRARDAQEKTYRFLSAIAGNLPHFVEATRALCASDKSRFVEITRMWPEGIREFAVELSDDSTTNAHPE
jgi:hypothetical protein